MNDAELDILETRLEQRRVYINRGDGCVDDDIDPDCYDALVAISFLRDTHIETQKVLQAALDTARNMEQQRDQEAAIVSRIWEQLGNPSYEELNGRSIYDLIDELKAANKEAFEALAYVVENDRKYDFKPLDYTDNFEAVERDGVCGAKAREVLTRFGKFTTKDQV